MDQHPYNVCSLSLHFEVYMDICMCILILVCAYIVYVCVSITLMGTLFKHCIAILSTVEEHLLSSVYVHMYIN